MELKIEGRNLEISELLRAHISRKLGQVNRHLPAVTAAVVEVTAEHTRSHQERILVQVALKINGEVIRVEQRASTATAAVNQAVSRLGQSVSRYKGHAYRSNWARQYVSIGEQQAEDLAELDRKLARDLAPEEESSLVSTNGTNG